LYLLHEFGDGDMEITNQPTGQILEQYCLFKAYKSEGCFTHKSVINIYLISVYYL